LPDPRAQSGSATTTLGTLLETELTAKDNDLRKRLSVFLLSGFLASYQPELGQ